MIKTVVSADERKIERNVWIGWLVLFMVTAAIIAYDSSRSVVHAYRHGSLQWIAGQRLYEFDGVGGFTYFPQAAILFAPFAVLPTVIGEVLWRLVNIGAFAAGILTLARITSERGIRSFLPLMTLVSIPLAWDCARNGQATLMMTGFMLLAVTDWARGNWWRSTLWLALSVAVKPLSIVLVLLMAAIDRRMSWRIPVGMLALAVSPFLTQHPSYVLEQYLAWVENTTTAVHVGVVAHGWTTPFTGLRALTGTVVPERIQSIIRLGAAGVTLMLSYISVRRHDKNQAAFYVFSLATLYILLLSPRTENNTYAMAGPVIGLLLASAFLKENRAIHGALLSVLTLLMISSRLIQKMLATDIEKVWLSPLLAMCLAVYLLIRFFTDSASAVNAAAPQACSGRSRA